MGNEDRIIIKGYLLSPGRREGPGWLTLCGELITGVGGEGDSPPGGRVFDFGDNLVCPGFIDLHVHGGSGCDVMDGTAAALGTIARFHAGGGSTAFLGTTMSAEYGRLREVLAAAACYRSKPEQPGAILLGVHLEGPWLNPAKKGAHKPEELKIPTAAAMEEILSGPGVRHEMAMEIREQVKLVTLAPELPGSRELIAYLQKNGTRTAAGHCAAGFEELSDAVAVGLSHATHMYNAMGEFRHRDLGTAGILLLMPEITVDLIADGIHVDPGAIKILLALKGAGKVALITDATRAAGMPEGCYELGGRQIRVGSGAARLADGTLAGSILTMNRAVAYMVNTVGVPPVQAVRMASLNPAVILGLEGLYGQLEAGKRASITVLDREFNVVATFVEGKKVI